MGFGVMTAVILIAAVPAEAKGRQKSGSYSTSGGKSGTFQRSVNRESRGNVSKNTSWTNQDGQSGSKTRSRTWDKDSGTGTYERSFSGADGKERYASGTIAKTDTGFTSTGTRTNASGETLDVNRTVTRNEDGTVSVNKVVTNDEGENRTVNKTVTKTEDGRTVTGDYTGFSGNSGTFEKSVSRKDGVKTVSSSAVNAEGETASRLKTVTKDDGAVTREVTTTNFEGDTNTQSQTAAIVSSAQ